METIAARRLFLLCRCGAWFVVDAVVDLARERELRLSTHIGCFHVKFSLLSCGKSLLIAGVL